MFIDFSNTSNVNHMVRYMLVRTMCKLDMVDDLDVERLFYARLWNRYSPMYGTTCE